MLFILNVIRKLVNIGVNLFMSLSLESKQWLTEILLEDFKSNPIFQYTKMYFIESAGYLHLKFKDELRPNVYLIGQYYQFNIYHVFSDSILNISCHSSKEKLKEYIFNNLAKDYTKYLNRLEYK